MASAPTLTRGLLVGGALAGPLFIAVFTAAGSLRPDYDQLRHPVSSLALTGAGWVQTANFLVAGALLLALAAGMHRSALLAGRARAAAWLVGAAGVGLLGSGAFVTDPVSGYPPGAPDAIEYTPVGVLHDAAAMPVFLGLPAACVVLAVWALRTRRPLLGAYSLLSAVAGIVLLQLFSAGFQQDPALVGVAGLYQRACVVVLLGWTTAVALVLLRAEPAGPREGAGGG
ncbi:DUF998 domain-containing protein [Nocardiopsis suaedae]|uniref:DUF998 domain-containing protein n=1 Tax=Nocardiopsis suaedae TaxID=3018444 RepID=A0ABT4THB8_9ACTN|nr:DUF998 domain-containing protein [Nocardiopsis suaedae]MDA2804100.1 DUF998 domain-containing protein [Nocardiopsis suaedae]